MTLSMKLVKKAGAVLSIPKQKGKEYSESHAWKLKKNLIQRCNNWLSRLGLTIHIHVTLKVKSKSGFIEVLKRDDQI